MGRGVPICAVVVALVAPQIAEAARLDAGSAHKALQAWVRFTSAGVATLPHAQAAENAFVASVTTNCPNALAALDAPPPESMNWKVLSRVFGETVVNADIAASSPLQTPFNTFASRISKLPWSTRGLRDRVKRSLDLQRRYIFEPRSDLCGNANAIAASGGGTVPDGTLQFLIAAQRNASTAGLGALAQVVGRYARHTKSNARLYRQLDSTVGEYQVREMDIVFRTQDKLLQALGLTKPQEIVAQDESAKSDARNMVSAVELCFTETQDYGKCDSAGELGNTGLDYGSAPGQVEVLDASRTNYRVVAHSRSGTDFTITKLASGSVTLTCSRPGVSTCADDGTW